MNCACPFESVVAVLTFVLNDGVSVAVAPEIKFPVAWSFATIVNTNFSLSNEIVRSASA